MKLYEHEAKDLLKRCGVRVPPGIVTDNRSYINLSFHKERYKEFFFEHKQVVIKAQVKGGGRKKQGLIVESDNFEDSLKQIDGLYRKEHNGRLVTKLLIEKRLEVAEEHFLAIMYDTRVRKPVILFSKEGGIEVGEVLGGKRFVSYPISLLHGMHDFQAREIAKLAGFAGLGMLQVAGFIRKAFHCFAQHDCRSLEINPIIRTKDGLLYAGDAKVIIDDNAVSRQEVFSALTEIEDETVLGVREREARKIDYHDHRGVAGKTFVELDGDIAVLASGGGASLTCMDALIQAGGRPANYTEYSGNPPKEKVRRLTEITLAKPGLNGCLVIGGTANFTDIFETLSGFAEGLQETKPKPLYPFVIRRAGPNDRKGFAMLRDLASREQYDITLFGEETPMAKAARIMVEKAEAYRKKGA